VWRSAFDDFLLQRLKARYLNPIQSLQDHGLYQGEGFSIVAIQVTLVEFLAATIAGISYRFLKPGERLKVYEYDKSGKLFAEFLATEEPFRSEFSTVLAGEFYRNVRCALLHEARTKQGWSIWAQSDQGRIVDGNRKIVFRNDFQRRLEEFLDLYRDRIGADLRIQEAFIRKMDSLCFE